MKKPPQRIDLEPKQTEAILERVKTALGDGDYQIIKAAFEKGLLLLGCGENSIRFCPALTVTAEEIDKCLSIFDDAIQSVASRSGED